MPALNAQKVISTLLRKGFIKKDESHHHYYEFWHNGLLVTRTFTSHSGKDIDDYLICKMRKQCQMDKQFFLSFIDCIKTKEDYLELLESQKLIIKK